MAKKLVITRTARRWENPSEIQSRVPLELTQGLKQELSMLGRDFRNALKDGDLDTIIVVDVFVSLHGTRVEDRAIVTTLISIVQIVLIVVLEAI